MGKKCLPVQVLGARENNLKDLTFELPENKYIAVTGLSGSGKSSLAFSTLFAEGQRRYIETFSPYTRQFFDKVKKPDVTSVENVRPSVAIQQRTRVSNSRSTVGSMTNINDSLKVLWSALSRPYSPNTGAELLRWTPASLVDELFQILNDACSSIFVCARIPLVTDEADRREQIAGLIARGFSRYLLESALQVGHLEEYLDAEGSDTLILVLDRVRPGAADKDDMRDSLSQAFELSRGSCLLVINKEDDTSFLREFHSSYSSTDPEETELDFSVEPPRPALFSYNSPIGACPECKGFGKVLIVDEEKVVPNPGLSLDEGALACWNGPAARREFNKLKKFCAANGIAFDKPWRSLRKGARELLLHHKSREYRGVFPWFTHIERKAYKMHVRVFLSRYRSQFDCPECGGRRLRPEALLFKLGGLTLPELWELPAVKALEWTLATRAGFKSNGGLSRDLAEVFSRCTSRLQYLVDLGLGHLTLARQSRTLSGGETQRVNLATALGSELVSTMFVLDEPSVGLHPRDTSRLIKSMKALQSKGNSLVVVEHDLDCIDAADHILELGPGAGETGGKVTFNGERESWPGLEELDQRSTRTRTVPVPFIETLEIRQAGARNLKSIDIDIPVGYLTTITGVSGSGKSTLVAEVLLRAWREHTSGARRRSGPDRVHGFSAFTQVLMVDQSSLAKSPRANIATYSGIWDSVRAALASTEAAKIRSLDKSAFSFNVDGGRCPACKGAGYIKEDMQFLSDVYVRCEVCLGRRFQEKPLEVYFRDRNADDWLKTTVQECKEVFSDQASVVQAAETLTRLGLGHLCLGHPLSELSGGEAQRLKLVPFISEAEKGESLLIFDEPTTGLHLNDVHRLIEVLQRLRDLGHTVLCVEHNLELVGASDWLVDLGPEGGDGGGELVLAGPPSLFLQTKSAKRSYTAKYLAEYYPQKERLTAGSAQTGAARDDCSPAEQGTIDLTVEGARQHNLKDIDVHIPHDRFVALTGVSGSGKSTIAKDIIYAEGQRRYLDCLSPYARQFIRELSKPDIDDIKNVRPTVCVYQHTFQPSRLSTVGTLAEVYSFMRLLFAKAGVQYCPDHPEQAVTQISAREVAERIMEKGDEPVRLLAPVIKMKKGLHKTVFQRAAKLGIDEVRADSRYGSPADFREGLERAKPHSIEYVTAQFVPSRLNVSLVREAVEETFAIGGGTVIVAGKKADEVFSRERACPQCNRGFFRPDPEDLSFHSRRGRCETCEGRGVTARGKVCPRCHGAKINEIGRAIRIGCCNIHQAALHPAPELLKFFEGISWEDRLRPVVEPVLREIASRLQTLIRLGLDYIPLDRSCEQLSSGELQRLRLAAAMGTPLCGAMYILDEPSAGLHPLDNRRVLSMLHRLREQGNSVLLIEHDETSIMSADYIIEVGPGGGREGGAITYCGPQKDFTFWSDESSNGAKPRRAADDQQWLHIQQGSCNNIDGLELNLPMGRITSIAGVSGAGKSSLVFGILLATLEGKVREEGLSWNSEFGELHADAPIERVLVVDQAPIGKNARSTPALYLKIWDEIRKLFAGTIEARARGFTASYFSFNSGKGRCPHCMGRGRIRLDMSFLTEAFVTCEHCLGSRYTEEALAVHYKGYSCADVLKMTFNEAREVFANHRKIHHVIHHACELGLGYLALGQSSATLSGGESQRIKLVSELSRKSNGHTIYILDEPTVGLHRRDVSRLVAMLRSLTAKGNTVVLIEHDHDVLKASDYLVEMGPGPGEAGGRIVAQGSFSDIKRAKGPWAQVLKNANQFAVVQPPRDR